MAPRSTRSRLTESASCFGGQLTSQAVPPDEHPWVESTGTTARYRQLRDAVRMRYWQTTVSCIGCRPMRPAQMLERGMRECGCVLKCLGDDGLAAGAYVRKKPQDRG
jgi:hypothetical protein